jgi:DNA-binding MarR family transcriptional regulator
LHLRRVKLMTGVEMSTNDRRVGAVEELPMRNGELSSHALAIISFIYNRVIVGAAPALRKQVGLSVTEARIVLHVGVAEWKTANELAKNLALDKAAISRAIARLIDLGLMVAERDPDHAARNLLELTEAGRTKSQQIASFTFAREDYLLSVLTDSEQGQFLRSLQKILTNVEPVNELVAQGRFWE